MEITQYFMRSDGTILEVTDLGNGTVKLVEHAVGSPEYESLLPLVEDFPPPPA